MGCQEHDPTRPSTRHITASLEHFGLEEGGQSGGRLCGCASLAPAIFISLCSEKGALSSCPANFNLFVYFIYLFLFSFSLFFSLNGEANCSCHLKAHKQTRELPQERSSLHISLPVSVRGVKLSVTFFYGFAQCVLQSADKKND